MKIDILFEDNHLLIVNKASGELSQGDFTGDVTLLDHCKAYIKEKYNKPGNVFLSPVHRLDRPVSGCLIFGRTSKALSRMTQKFKNNEVTKTYLALSDKIPTEPLDTLTHYLRKDDKSNSTKTCKEGSQGAKKAVLDYELLGVDRNISLLKVVPVTGRSHQIRVQLQSIKCPIIGDTKYGSKIKQDDDSIALHCYKLEFLHPVTEQQLRITAAVPRTKYWDIMKSLITAV